MIYNILLGNQEGIGIKYFNPLWFLISLFTMRIFSSFLNDKNIIYATIASIILAIILYYSNCYSYNNDYFQLSTTLICFPFFAIGNICKNYNFKMSLSFQNKYRLLITFCAIIIVFVIGYFNGNVNVFRATNVGNDIIIFYIVSFILCYLIIGVISSFFNIHNSCVETISNGTVLILCTHQFFIVQINNIIPLNTISSIILSFLILFFSYYLIKVSLKYCPILLGK